MHGCSVEVIGDLEQWHWNEHEGGFVRENNGGKAIARGYYVGGGEPDFDIHCEKCETLVQQGTLLWDVYSGDVAGFRVSGHEKLDTQTVVLCTACADDLFGDKNDQSEYGGVMNRRNTMWEDADQVEKIEEGTASEVGVLCDKCSECLLAVSFG